jgi:hypothetical protein
VVTVYAHFGRHEQVARHEITVLPVALTLDQSPDGTVYVHNTAPYELDISGFVIDGYRRFTFPPRSIILPNQTITLSPNRRLGDIQTGVVMHDTEGVVVAHSARRNEVMATIANVSPSGVAESVVVRQPEPVSTPPVSNITAFTFANQRTPGDRATETGSNTALLSESASSATATQRTDDDRLPTLLSTTTNRSTSPFSDHRAWPYLAFIGLLLTALFAVWRLRPPVV